MAQLHAVAPWLRAAALCHALERCALRVDYEHDLQLTVTGVAENGQRQLGANEGDVHYLHQNVVTGTISTIHLDFVATGRELPHQATKELSIAPQRLPHAAAAVAIPMFGRDDGMGEGSPTHALREARPLHPVVEEPQVDRD